MATPVREALNIKNYLLEDAPTQRRLLNEANDPLNTFSFRNPYSKNSILLQQQGLLVHRLHIDSRNRRTTPENIIAQTYYLEPNSLFLTANSSKLLVRLPGHGLTSDDRVTLLNLGYPTFKLKNALSFEINSDLIAINHPNHGITQEMIDNIPFKIEISGVQGTNNLINNIPVSLINGVHEVLLRELPSDPIDPDYYYIRLPLASNQTSTDTSNVPFTIRYYNIFGIPINYINAYYPIGIMNEQGFHDIEVVDADSFEVDIGLRSVVSVEEGFGSGVVVQRIASTQPAYPNSNEYFINFPVPYKNVKHIQIVNSEFPVVQNLVRAGVNNVLKLQILNDGDFIYSFALPDGNYTFSALIQELLATIGATTRSGREDASSLFINDNTNKPLTLLPTIICSIDYSIEKNYIRFSLFEQVGILEPLSIDPASYPDLKTRLLINYKNHGLQVGDFLEIGGAVDLGVVPAEVINGEFVVEAVVDANNVRVVLERYNDLAVPGMVIGGGKQVTVRTALQFRLLFNHSDSLGDVIGFHNVGRDFAVTAYATSNDNRTAYPNDLLIDSIGNPVPIQSTFKLSPENYIFMVTDAIIPTTNTNGVQNALAKIGLYGDSGTYIYDSYNQLARPFDDNLSELFGLTVRFLDARGRLYNFYDLEHSYILEIYEERTELLTASQSTRQG